MKAVVFKEHGSVDKLVYDDFEEPEIHPSEVIVKVNACGINHSKEDFADKVNKFTDGRGVDVVFEHIGPETWEKSFFL